MNLCGNCKTEIMLGRKYCSSSCANKINNKLYPKRKPEGFCKICRKPIKTVQTYCGECKKEKKQQSNIRARETHRIAVFEWRRKLKLKAIAYLGHRCSVCGYDRCPGALDFHHKDGSTKDFTISGSSYRTLEVVKAELDKCILLCANCHREHHYNSQITVSDGV